MSDEVYVKEHFIASLDLLGGKSLINNDTEDFHLNNIRNIYENWKVRIPDGDPELKKIKIKIFSDNMLVAIETEQPNALQDFLQFVSFIAENFLESGYKVRGGITVGSLYLDDIIVWGKGLVEAYIMESEKAKNPRIIISDTIVKKMPPNMKESMISRDEDYYILNYICKGNGMQRDQRIAIIDKALERLEDEEASCEKIRSKNKYLKEFSLKNKE